MNQLYLTAKEFLGKNLCPRFKERGCVESLRAVFLQATGEELADTYSTQVLYSLLQKDKRFQTVKEPITGDIVVSPTQGDNIGHCGIIGENGDVFSNNSATLFWDIHYNLTSWKKKFALLPLRYFRYVPIIPPKSPEIAPNSPLLEQLRQILVNLQIWLKNRK